MRVSLRVGIGDSLAFLRKQSRTAAKLAGGYRPDPLVDGLAPVVTDPDMHIAGWHLFTFNSIRNTEAWRQQLLARYARTTA
jgi:methylenetetrahydrofolate reductase (NADPH)